MNESDLIILSWSNFFQSLTILIMQRKSSDNVEDELRVLLAEVSVYCSEVVQMKIQKYHVHYLAVLMTCHCQTMSMVVYADDTMHPIFHYSFSPSQTASYLKIILILITMGHLI